MAEEESITFPIVARVLFRPSLLGVVGLLAWFVLPLMLVDMVMAATGMPAQGQGAAAAWVLMFSCPIGAVIGLVLGCWSDCGGRNRGRRYGWSLAWIIHEAG
jgi:hypothetical protein